MNPKQFRIHIVRRALHHVGLYSHAAENLLMGTAATESGGFEYLDQITGPDDTTLGPAYGLFQIEAATHMDLFKNMLNYPKWQVLKAKVNQLSALNPPLPVQLASNLCYASAIARVIYYRDSEPLPEADDLQGLARYYKRVYNTSAGKGSAEKFIEDARHHNAWDGAAVVPV